jgi:hypothetical protein
MRIIQSMAKIADATDELAHMTRELDEAIVDVGGDYTLDGQQIEAILGTVARLASGARNLLYHAPTEQLAAQLPPTGYAALAEVVAAIQAVAYPATRPTDDAMLERIARIQRMQRSTAGSPRPPTGIISEHGIAKLPTDGKAVAA